MAATIGSSHAAAQTKWINELFQGFISENPLQPITTNRGGNGVLRLDTPEQKSGSTYKYHFQQEVSNGSWRSGDERLSGQGQALALTTDSVTIQRDRVAVPIENWTDSDQRTVISLDEWTKKKLIRAGSKRIANQMMTALTDTTSGRTQNRYLYANAEGNYNATHATALGNITAADTFSLNTIDQAIFKARYQGSGGAAIMPADVMAKDNTIAQKFVLMLDPASAYHLRQDPNFKNYVLYKDNPVFDVISGSLYMGMYNGALIYEFGIGDPNLRPLYAGTVGSGSTKVAHNLLLGSTAGVLAFGVAKPAPGAQNVMSNTAIGGAPANRIFIDTEVSDHAGNLEIGLTMTSGYRKLVDASSGTSEDFGVVHLFNTAEM